MVKIVISFWGISTYNLEKLKNSYVFCNISPRGRSKKVGEKMQKNTIFFAKKI